MFARLPGLHDGTSIPNRIGLTTQRSVSAGRPQGKVQYTRKDVEIAGFAGCTRSASAGPGGLPWPASLLGHRARYSPRPALCKMQWVALQGNKYRQRRPNPERPPPISKRPCSRKPCRAICTLEGASSCILHTQPRSGGVGAFDPARHFPFLAQSKVLGRWLWTRRLRGFRRRLTELDSLPPIAAQPWHTTG